MVAAHLLNLEAVSVVHGARTLLDGVSLGLDAGMRVGVVGRNGAGKSTLLRVLARFQDPDEGRVTHAGSLRLGALWQSDDLDPGMTVREAVIGQRADHEWATDARVRDVLTGLLGGLEAPAVGGFGATFGRLSGGQRRRVGLARVLVHDADLVLLDEPTNHLDIQGVAWLAEHLRSRPGARGALAVVTHDRWFLDAVCSRIWEVHDGLVDGYDGGYAAYVLTRAERARLAAATQERRNNLLRKELAWLRRGAPARTSKPRFRLEAAAALIADEPPPRDSVGLSRMAVARLGKQVIDCEQVTVAVGSGDTRRLLLDGVTWRLGPGERIGLIGENGSGKTTLLRLLTGEVEPDAGLLRRGKTVRTAMLTQDVAELDALADLRVQEAVEQVRGSVRVGDREVSAGQLLERLGFVGDRVRTPVGDLSGGERRRLQLLRLLMTEPNVLLLDEPTNDLDTDTLAAVEDLLDGWPGTLIVVSHDRYLLERVCDRHLALLPDGSLLDLPGGIEDYLRLRRGPSPSTPGAAGSPPGTSGLPAGTAGLPAGTGDPGRRRSARKDMQRLERQLARLATREEQLHAGLVAAATDHVTVQRVDAELRELLAERDRLEEAWLGAAEAAE